MVEVSLGVVAGLTVVTTIIAAVILLRLSRIAVHEPAEQGCGGAASSWRNRPDPEVRG